MRTTQRFTPTATAALSILAALLVAGLPAVAGERVVSFDPAATEVHFTLEATGHDVHGQFHFHGGELHFDPATGTASGKLEVDAVGAETGNGSRDKTMHNKVLESARFPLFVFTAERIEGEVPTTGSGQVAIHGTLSMHGGDHPFTLPTELTVDGDHFTATSSFAVPYQEWGLHDPSILFLRVADEVQVEVTAAGDILEGEEMVASTTGR